MKGGLLLDVIIRKSTTVFKLLLGDDQMLLVGRDPFLVLDRTLLIMSRRRRFDLESDSFTGERLDEYLHAATKMKD